MQEDRSNFTALDPLSRRQFLSGLFAVGAAAAVPLPAGVEDAQHEWVTLGESFTITHYQDDIARLFIRKVSEEYVRNNTALMLFKGGFNGLSD